MKVKITLQEIQYYEITKEVEVSKEEYKYYCENGFLPDDKHFPVECELSDDIDYGNHLGNDRKILSVVPTNPAYVRKSLTFQKKSTSYSQDKNGIRKKIF